ncbi:conserved hypothetical protein [Gloeothece citriformis PCC 7424]|uniref:Peptidase M48 domain-containing protein n=1 Tax=Gloeothece citriformis (strain PCC 7424) TaxID=65393 RepID=B7K6V1_GLOC7|nr:M56 family metallopeptidase [Gloeothece citriformis]ACK72650.1 conserved hypothetical protein [Gloeothece citriformis PCC 7424]
MHLLMILTALGLAWGIRLFAPSLTKNSLNYWQRSLFFFLFPPLLLLMTSVAVIVMGYHGQMFGLEASWYSYLLAGIFLIVALVSGVKLAYQGWHSVKNLSSHPQKTVFGKPARILNIDFPYSAQIGFWKPELVISQGLLNTLDQEHLQAVLAHEQAHDDYHDTFWFFWLGWLRSFTRWLPHTERLWEELLFLREVRADYQASKQIDALVLAESLLIVAQQVTQTSFEFSAGNCSAALHDSIHQNRLGERINALLSEDKPVESESYTYWSWGWLPLSLLPLTTVPWHC